MKNFLRNLGENMRRSMIGRYGTDELSRAMSVAAMIGLVLSCLPKLKFLYIPTLILVIWVMVRTYSRNIQKRYAERAVYLRITAKIRGWFSVRKRMWRERKSHRYYRCKQCSTMLRVPKRKGKIVITCPKCHGQITKRT